MNDENPQDIVDEATFEFTMGEHQKAINLIGSLIEKEPNFFAAHHALAEIYFDLGDYDKALSAGQKALEINEADVHLHTSLSRIWMEKGNKDEAEKHGARARILGWKNELKEPSES